MEVRLAALADMANVDGTGKLNVIGVFDEIHCKTLPVVHPSLSLAISLEASPAEGGQSKEFRVVGLNPDGIQFAELGGNFMVPSSKRPGQRIVMNLVLTLSNLKIEMLGDHGFSIMVNGEEKRHVGLYIGMVPSDVGSNDEPAIND